MLPVGCNQNGGSGAPPHDEKSYAAPPPLAPIALGDRDPPPSELLNITRILSHPLPNRQ